MKSTCMFTTLFMFSVASNALSCDRSCLKKLSENFLEAAVAHDLSRVALTEHYAATENMVPMALGMMQIWHSASAIKNPYFVVDPVSDQVFFTATLLEDSREALLFGRLKVEREQFKEIELYISRSRGQSGYRFDPRSPAHLPPTWTEAIAPERRAGRQELQRAARSMFDTSVVPPTVGKDCLVMENGVVVMDGPPGQSASSDPPTPAGGSGSEIPVVCKVLADRPVDAQARADILDEESGVVVAMGIARGVVQSFPIPGSNDSNFLPYSLRSSLAKTDGRIGKEPSVRTTPATAAVAEMHRIYDHKLQGLNLLINIEPAGTQSPWSTPKRPASLPPGAVPP